MIDEQGIELRNLTYGLIVRLGRVPSTYLVHARQCRWDANCAWYGDRVAPGRRPHTREQDQGILDGFGLAGELWRLP